MEGRQFPGKELNNNNEVNEFNIRTSNGLGWNMFPHTNPAPPPAFPNPKFQTKLVIERARTDFPKKSKKS